MREIILQFCHEKSVSGTVMWVESDVTSVLVPLICSCQLIFKPTGWAFDKEGREIWKQVD